MIYISIPSVAGALWVSALLLVSSLTTKAAAQTNEVTTQLKNVADKIRAKVVAWRMPEADLAPELKELDTTLPSIRAAMPKTWPTC